MANPIINFFYRFKIVRQLGRKLLSRKTINQPFYNGFICFNAVEFNFFWVNGASCQQVDKDIQDTLLALSQDKEYFIDIGANIGIMTLSVALRNPRIHTIAYDPNKFILAYLNQSIKKNKLTDRVIAVNAAVSNEAGTAYMDFATGPYSGHLADKGMPVTIVDFDAVLKEYSDKKTLFKMDIEGFEKNLIPAIVNNKNPAHCFVIEIHPKGLNGISDPEFVLQQLLATGYTITDIHGKEVRAKSEITDWENVVCYYKQQL